MSLKYIANEDLTVAFDNLAGPPGIAYSGDVDIDPVAVKPVLSIKCKALDKQVATSPITIIWSPVLPCPHKAAGHTFTAGAGTITATATKTKAAGNLVLRVEDTGNCKGSWVNSSTSATVPCSCNCEISDAGQAKAKAQ